MAAFGRLLPVATGSFRSILLKKSAFESAAYGHSGLLDMIRTYDLLHLIQENGGHWTVGLAAKEEESAEHAAHA